MSFNNDVFEPIPKSNGKQRAILVEWFNSLLPHVNLPQNTSDEDLRAFLADGTVLCQILSKLKPGSVAEHGGPFHTSEWRSENVKRFLTAMENMGLPTFQLSDLEKGSMTKVLECLLTLRSHFMPSSREFLRSDSNPQAGVEGGTRWKLLGDCFRSGNQKEESNRGHSSPFHRALHSPVKSEPSAALMQHVGHKFHEVFQLKSGRYSDLPASKISAMMKSNSLDVRSQNAPTQSLLSVVNGILDESVERKNGEIPHRVALLLRKVLQEIERRISTQAEHLKTQNSLFKAREEKYKSRIDVLEALANTSSEETEVFDLPVAMSQRRNTGIRSPSRNLPVAMNQPQRIKNEQIKTEEKKKVEEQEAAEVIRVTDDHIQEIAALKQELESARKTHQERCLEMEKEAREAQDILQKRLNEAEKLLAASKSGVKDDHNQEVAALKEELESARKNYEERCLEMETDGRKAQSVLQKRLDEAEKLLAASKSRVKDDDNQEVVALKQELESARKAHEERCLEMETEAREAQNALQKRLDEAEKLSTASKSRLKDDHSQEIAALKQELESARKTHEERCLEMETEAREAQNALQKRLEEAEKLSTASKSRLKDDYNQEIAALKQELESARKAHLEMETEAREAQNVLQKRLNEVEKLLTASKRREKELEAASELTLTNWQKKEHIYQIFTEFQLGALRELRFASQSIKQELGKTQKGYSEEFHSLGLRIKALQNASEGYYAMLAENRKLHNELQELKGNIRVYCRVRPFIPGQKAKESIVEYVGDNGELIVTNPAKQGKESRRSFKFNKVYGPSTTQVQVFTDTQPLIQSVLDGYNVCIFAYGQTGSGKTYTMTGPDGATEEEWGVNYRALNTLFRISQSRESTFAYEISVQMVEIYNEQVRDLLTSDGSQKRLGILTSSKQNGLAVPDASVYPVKATSDVMHLMEVGLKNRAKSTTAMNERSSRSHSIVSIHARGVDQKTGSSLQGSLHLVDLAGSERIDRSEVTGDRLKEAQHINKSLSALGDVIAALAQKNAHVPYRNSKLTQVLQSSLGGNAKTLMFVQLNPEANSYSESLSTLKFAERASGVELGAAKSSKDGRDVRELMEQVASLKDTIAKKDEEIERLQLNGATDSLRYESPSPRTQRSMKLSGGGGEKAASDEDNSESSDTHSVDSFQQHSDDLRYQKDETDGSMDTGKIPRGGAKPSEITDKPRITPRSPKTSTPRTPDRSPRLSTGIRKSPSAAISSPKPPPRRL